MEFSLILATLGRTDPVSNFLLYLSKQSYSNFELIVVDQNEDERLTPLLTSYADRISLKHIRSKKGLSRARNAGLKHATGSVIAFPDDDCWYEPEALRQVANRLQQHPDWDGITTGCMTPTGRLGFLEPISGPVDKLNVWRRAISITIFLRDFVVKRVGEFDEKLGVGSDGGLYSGEETDYLLRALANEFRIFYQSDLHVNHPDTKPCFTGPFVERAYGYGRGLGWLLKKYDYPLWYVGKAFLRSFGGMMVSVISLNLPQARYYFATLRGRVVGWCE